VIGGHDADDAGRVVGLDHVQVAAPPGCEDEARAFYGRLIGLPELAKPEALRGRGGVWFACGAQQLHIGADPGFTAAAKAHPAFAVATPLGVDVLAERLTTAGVELTWDEALPGIRRFFAADPWGNRLEFLCADAQQAEGQA
jgi:catechol 2,3-dioxygenase-like lactoylglutathione lyase family enzyme